MENTRSEYRPGLIVKYSATMLVVALLAYAAFLAAQSWRETKSEQATQLATIATLSANSVDVYFSQLQIGMQNLGEDLASMRNKPDLAHAFTLVKRFQALHTELGNVMLIRGDGQILLTGATPNQPGLPTLAGIPLFKQILAELQASPHFAIGQPVIGTIDKSWVVSARYAVTDSSGRLLYILSANLPTDILQRYWIDASSPKITALGLLRDDGYMVARYPQPNVASLDEIFGKPAEGAMAEFLRASNHPQQGQLEMRDSDGKMTGLLAMRRLQHYPLTLFVEMPVSEIKSAWWHNIHAPYFLMALLLACTFGFYSLKLRRRAWTLAQRREALQRNYQEALQEGGPYEIIMFNTDTLQITYANDFALGNLGYSLAQLQQKNMLSLHPEMSIESFGTMIEPLRRGERESVTYQTVQARANGSTYPVDVNMELIKSEDDGERFLAIIYDLSAIKQAEESIQKLNAPVERRTAGEN